MTNYHNEENSYENFDISESKNNLLETLQNHLTVLQTELANEYPYEVKQAIKSRIIEIQATKSSIQKI